MEGVGGEMKGGKNGGVEGEWREGGRLLDY